jgi:hypothetical protein
VDDDERTNEGPASASALDPLLLSTDAVICAFTEDWYALEVAQAGQVEARLTFVNAVGDLDLVILDQATGVELGASRTEDDQEVVRLVLDEPATLLIRVDGFDEAQNDYTLTWSLP